MTKAVAHTTESREDPGRTLARYARDLTFEDLPPEVVALTKRCILDTLGTTLAGSGLAPEASILRDYVKDVGGREECTLVGLGGKAPAQIAALVNGALSHMLDYDDGAGGHVSVATVPLAFTMADRVGNVSGRELITAVAAGIDIHVRIFPYDASAGEEWDTHQKFSQTQSIGYFSGAAVAGRIAGLNEEQMINAFGLAYQQLSGAHQRHLGAQPGWAGQDIVLAVFLAQRGVPGVYQLLDGPVGFFHAYMRDIDQPDYDRLTGGLGTRFGVLQKHAFKRFPSCGLSHRPINAVLDLRATHRIRPEDVEWINVTAGEHVMRLARPLDKKRRPPHSAEAKYSIPFICAAAMVHGNVTLGTFTDGGLKDEKVLEMAQRVNAILDTRPMREMDSALIEIRTKDGKSYSRELGNSSHERRPPSSQEQIEDKFRDCAAYSAKPLSKADIERVITMVRGLENIRDVREISGMLG